MSLPRERAWLLMVDLMVTIFKFVPFYWRNTSAEIFLITIERLTGSSIRVSLFFVENPFSFVFGLTVLIIFMQINSFDSSKLWKKAFYVMHDCIQCFYFYFNLIDKIEGHDFSPCGSVVIFLANWSCRWVLHYCFCKMFKYVYYITSFQSHWPLNDMCT